MKNYGLGLLTLVAALAVSQPALGVWSDTFTGGFDQPSWSFVNVTGLGGPSGTFTTSTAANYLAVSDPTPAGIGGAAFGFGVVTAESFTDTAITGTLNPALGTSADLVLFARIDPVLLTGYGLSVDFTSGVMDIVRFDGGGATTDLVSGVVAGFSATSSYFAELKISGNNLAGRILDVAGGSVLASASVTDASFASGLAGVGVNANNFTAPLDGSFDDINVVVPEPTSLALMAIGAVALLRRKHSSQVQS